jgi:hypothetical protein
MKHSRLLCLPNEAPQNIRHEHRGRGGGTVQAVQPAAPGCLNSGPSPEPEVTGAARLELASIPVRTREPNDVEVRHGQQLGLARRHPVARLRALTLGAVPVAATVVGDHRVAAGVVLATPHVSAESRRATALDRAHHLQLVGSGCPLPHQLGRFRRIRG